MKKRILSLLVASLAATALPAEAADLLQIYRAAQDNDAIFSAARASLDAGREKLPQGRANLLPSLTLSGNTIWNESKIKDANLSYNYNSNAYQLTLSQPLFRWQNWIGYDQSKIQVAQAEANFNQARQDLILRVAQAYFDVNYAIENLKAVRASKSAIELQLESAKKNFEVGTSTITDTHEAQARFDLAVSQEISAANDLEVKKRLLQAIIGNEPGPLAPTRKDVELSAPQPNDMSQWVSAAERDSISVQVQQANVDLASREIDKQRAGHYPTVDAVINYGTSKAFNASVARTLETDYQNAGIQINIPLYQGGSILSRQREAAANLNNAQANLEAQRRNSALAARQYYLGVVNGLAQIKALRAALVSSQSALESNKLGYEVGVRINIDVLNAENQVYQTRRDLAKAVVDTLMAQLRLKSAVGSLADTDIEQLNQLLDPAAAE